MNKNTYKASIAFNILLLLAGCVTSAYAQPAKGAPENPSRQPGQERRRPNTENYDRGAVAQAIAENQVHVTIRYKKEYGYKSESGPVAGTGPNSCSAFSVRPNISIGRGGVLIPVYVHGEPKMREVHGYYYCDFLVSELPFDKQITITAEMWKDSLTEAWRGGSQPQPAAGWQRVVDEGSRTVTLTPNEPRATMNFEMVYQVDQPSLDSGKPRTSVGQPIFRKP